MAFFVQNLSSLGMRAELLKLQNQKRKAEGKKPLKLNPQLSKAAQAYAEFLAKSGKFSHTAEVGFGVAKDQRGRTLWVIDFGDR